MTGCYVCDNSQNNKSFTIPEMMLGLRDQFNYFECSKCGCLQISDTHFDISKYYPTQYYSLEEIPEEKMPINWTKRKVQETKNQLWRKKVKYELLCGNRLENMLYRILCRISSGKTGFTNYSAISRIPLNKDSRIIDVGCGSGKLLYALKNLGFKNLSGCDPNIADNIKYENGLQILKEPLENISGKWDLIMFHHSFEHISRQLETLRVASNLLSDDGTCLVRIPTTSSFAWKHYVANWVQLDAPRHLYLHSIQSMKILAEKVDLNLRETIYDSTAFQFWGSEQYAQNIPLASEKSYDRNPSDSVFSQKQIAEFSRKAVLLNKTKQGDQAAFFFKRFEKSP